MSISPCISYDYTLVQDLIKGQKYVAVTFLLWCCRSLVSGLIYSTLILDVYGLIWCLLYLLSIAPHCNETVPLVQHYFIKNGTLNGVSYFYAAWVLSMTLSSTLAVLVGSFTIFVNFILIYLTLLVLTY